MAGLAFLAGCQGVSTGANIQTQTTTLSLASGSLNFGNVAAGSSKTMTVNATNSGPDSVTVSSASVSTKYFALTAPSLPANVAAGQTTPITITFTPNAAGTFSASLSITSNASNTTSEVMLNGVGTAETSDELTSSPTSLAFGSVTVGITDSLPETVTNSGSSTITISHVGIGGVGFSFNGITTPVTLTAGQSATFNVTFSPTSAANSNGNLTVTSTASNSALTVPLSATGISAAAGSLGVSPGTIAVGSVVDGTSGTASGSLTATGGSVTVTAASTNNSAFSVSGLSLPVTISAGQSVPFTVTFSPQSTGAASATLTFASNASPSTTTGAATGTGTAAPTYSVNLSWTASTSSGISGYNIYRAIYTSSCGSYSKINSLLNTTTLYTDSVVVDGKAYCYATTAVNTSSEESGYSNIVSNVQIPAP